MPKPRTYIMKHYYRIDKAALILAFCLAAASPAGAALTFASEDAASANPTAQEAVAADASNSEFLLMVPNSVNSEANSQTTALVSALAAPGPFRQVPTISTVPQSVSRGVATVAVSAVPEPSTVFAAIAALLVLGLTALRHFRRRMT